jgi:GxxExxY protein
MNADVAQMNVLLDRTRLNGLSEMAIGAAHTVSSTLGHGFLEKVYENSLCHELRKRGLDAQQQIPLQVTYDGIIVGDYIPDLLVNTCLIIEIKAVSSIDTVHRQQVLNYLRASDLRLGLLLNFGRARLEVGRVVNRF